MTFDDFNTEKHLYIGGKARTQENWPGGYDNEITKEIIISDEYISVNFEAGGSIVALISESWIEQHKGYVVFKIPFVGKAYLYRKELE